jgi:hypothetical protein
MAGEVEENKEKTGEEKEVKTRKVANGMRTKCHLFL